MSGPQEVAQWRIAGGSVCGASHIQIGKPNQDAIGWSLEAGDHLFVMAAADGHGAAIHARSDRGAKLAVSLTLACLQEFFSEPNVLDSDNTTVIVARIVDLWRQAVAADIAEFALTDKERRALDVGRLEPIGAYGSTLLAFLLTSKGGLAVQIGDGDIFLVGADEAVARAFVVPNLGGEATNSLCMPDAINVVQTRYFDESELRLLDGVVIATDGLGKSFRDDEATAVQVRSAVKRLNYDSAAAMTPDLTNWLKKVSAAGSGDDISMIIARKLLFEADRKR